MTQSVGQFVVRSKLEGNLSITEISSQKLENCLKQSFKPGDAPPEGGIYLGWEGI